MIGQKIKEIREQQGLTQSELSIKASVPQTTISGIENNSKSPNVKSLYRICKVLNINMVNLLESSDC